MINVFKVKKIAAPTIGAFLVLLPFWLVTQWYGILYGACAAIVGLVLNYYMVAMMLKNPFSQMLEGDGLLTLDINSKGVVSPLLMRLNSPLMVGKINGQPIEDYYNRRGISSIFAGKEVKLDEEMLGKLTGFIDKATKEHEKSQKYLKKLIESKADPELIKVAELDLKCKEKELELAKYDMELFGNSAPIQVKHKRILLNLSQEEFSDARCAFMQYPLLMYNSQLGSIITKDFLSEREKSFFVENKLLLLVKKFEELSANTKHMARHVIDLTNKSGNSIGKSIGIFIVIFLIVMVVGYLVATNMGWI